MKELLTTITEIAVLAIDTMALLIIVVGTFGAFFETVKVWLSRETGTERRNVWLCSGVLPST